MASSWTCFGLVLLLCLWMGAWAAPSVHESRQFEELDRVLKELATSVLAMGGALAKGDAGGAGDESAGDLESEFLGRNTGAYFV